LAAGPIRALAIPGLRVMLLAIRNYVMHQSANRAGSPAFSCLLAMFPLLVLVSAFGAEINGVLRETSPG
jgi:membrane protein